MNETKSTTHYYDTEVRGVRCGRVEPEHHSSKHVRSVNCPTCLERLADRPNRESASATAKVESTPAAIH